MSTATVPRELRDAAIHVCITLVVGIAVLIAAANTTGGLSTVLLLTSAGLVILGTLASMVRTYLNWRAGGRWQIWQGASWLLLGLSLLWFTGALPSAIIT